MRRPMFLLSGVGGALATSIARMMRADAAAESARQMAREPQIEPQPNMKTRMGERANGMKRRQRFIDTHNQNAMNFLPGWAVHKLYARNAGAKEAERLLFRLMSERNYKPKPGYVQQWFDHPVPF
jgi:hypothetical protein